MRTLKSILVVSILVIIAYGCGSNKKNSKIKIGIVLPLTGDAAIYGQAMKNGIMLAYNESSLKNSIELLFEDDMGENIKALNAGHSLINKSVDIVIGGAQSKTADVLIPLLTKNKISLVSPGASSVDFDKIEKYFFRLWPSDSYDGKIMADFVLSQNKKDGIAVFYTNSKYGVGVKSIFEETIKTTNGNIVFSEPFSEGTKDFRTQLVKIKNSKAKALFLPGYFGEVSIIIKQIRELGLNIKIYGTSSFYDEKLIETLGNSIDGVFFSYPDFDIKGDNEKTNSFSNIYYKKYNLKADVFAANAYDCFKIIENAISNGAKNSTEIQEQLIKIKNFNGAGGTFSFDKYGNVIKPFSIYNINKGEFILLKKNDL